MTVQRNVINGRYYSNVNINKDLLIAEYIVNNKSACQLSREYGCHESTIAKLLKKYNIVKHKRGSHRVKDLTNQKFDKLLVLSKKGNKWLCQCDCGYQFTTSTYRLCKTSKIKQCHNCSCPRLSHKELIRIYWTTLIKSAKKRNIEFNISMDYAYNLFISQNKKCKLSGIDIVFAKNKKEHMKKRGTSASLDRIDSNQGYVIGNVQWVHKDVNIMKHKFIESYFIQICQKIAQNYDNNKNTC